MQNKMVLKSEKPSLVCKISVIKGIHAFHSKTITKEREKTNKNKNNANTC